MPRLSRATAFLHRFALASESLGLYGSLRATLLDRFSSRLRRIHVPAASRDFYYRGWADAGVLSHLFQPGYRIVTPDDRHIRRIVDAGANIGDETLRFRAHHPDAEVIALEPEPGNFSVLERNFSDDDAVHCIRAGLWCSAAKLRILQGDRFESFRVEEVADEEPHDVDALSIPSILERSGWDGIDILKLDIEGAEYEVFSKGAEAWLPRVGALILSVRTMTGPGRRWQSSAQRLLLIGEYISPARMW